MPSGLDVAAALRGALRLARFDASGADAFGSTGLDAWRSFYAMVIVAPMFVVWVAIHGFGTPDETPIIFAVAYESVVYVGGWFLFPVLMIHVSRAIDRDAQFAKYITAYNWTAVIQNILFLVLDVIFRSIGAPEAARAVFGMFLLAYVLIYAWFVARTVLEIEPGQAAMIVGLDMLTALVWEQFSDGLV